MNACHARLWACTITLLVLALGAARPGHAAKRHVQAGDYTIYYNALTGADLPLVSTRDYGLRHSPRQGLVTIAANIGHGGNGTNVPLTVHGHATTLLGHPVPVKIRYVHDDRGDYAALVTFPVSANETVRFDLEVTPKGGPPAHLRFVHSY